MGMTISWEYLLKLSFFNHTAIRDVLAKVDITYTMADKEAPSIPFIHIDECTFLKRTWRHEPSLGLKVAPLDHMSIEKMLMVCVRTKTDYCLKQQAIAVIETAVSEYFWYGIEIFEEKRAFLQEIVKQADLHHYVTKSTFPSWEELVSRFEKSSLALQSRDDTYDAPHIDIKSRARQLCLISDAVRCTCLHCDLPVFDSEVYCDFCFYDPFEPKRLAVDEVKDPKVPFVCSYCYNSEYYGGSNMNIESGHTDENLPERSSKSVFTDRARLVPKFESLVCPNKCRGNTNTSLTENEQMSSAIFQDAKGIESRVMNSDNSQNQGRGDASQKANVATRVTSTTGGQGVVPNRSEAMGSGVQTQENVEFIDESVGEIMYSESLADNSYLNSMVPGADLAKFLSRPLPIQDFEWEIGTDPTFDFRPWHDYFIDARVVKKLDNYAFLSCSLKVKFVVNASPFLYGCAYASYQPLYTINPHTLSGVDEMDLPRLSQRPHIKILPQDCAGGEMQLPFFYHKDWLRVTRAADFTNMGRIEFREFVPLLSANGGTTSTVSVTVYAWAEDVKLAGPTIGLSMQSKDEYGTGIVSLPASAIATAAGYFENIPIIGRFATATQIGANAISGIASLFGWSNPPVVEDVKPYKSLVYHSVGTASLSEPVEKLTLDPKNEVTVDPTCTGLTNADEMSIPYIVQRESFLVKTSWDNTHSSGDQLFLAGVTPSIAAKAVVTNGYTIALTPPAHLAAMFKCWRGDLIFRFHVIATKYHKGRLAIIWDPVGGISSAADYTNVTYTKIIDIGVENDVEFRVPYMQAKPWLETEWSSFSNTELYRIDGVSQFFQDSDRRNGTINLRVLTKLTSPVDTADVSILVSVRGAPDLEFNSPLELSSRYSYWITPEVEEAELQSQDVPKVCHTTLAEASSAEKTRYLVNFGENINNMRTLLRRSSRGIMFDAETTTPAADWVFRAITLRQLPPQVGYDANGLHEDSATNAVTYGRMHPICWMQMCYMGRRGSTRIHIVAEHDGAYGNISVARADSVTNKTGTITDKSLAAITNAGLNYQMSTLAYYQEGAAVTSQLTQAGLSVELPLYNVNRFVSCDPLYNNIGESETDNDSNTFQLQYQHFDSNVSGTIDVLYSIGTDFNFLFYLDAPTIFVRNVVVAP